ncbi:MULTISPECIES: heme/hemin ABC transporter substrate-binding protein [Dyella]|uniref:Hemin ABC transporter substrate-binding protein n=2 Tax=Dyella TaxID=231454 RepID=A0A4R0YIN6_9GAMM|nr:MULTISPECIES: ABC transporter substrate-binding protein [Dyella]TBR36650.1 hemin ABC transporter substrate-binding protein [Dyella terrae]TCI08259.1 hemin ABC transporter substrate-binding protein [Dyella soli]
MAKLGLSLLRRMAFLGIAAIVALTSFRAAAETPVRVVALGGDITETIYALGAESSLVGVDSTSLWPEAAQKLPNVGYVRQLSAEGILALHPQLIIATHDAGPAAVIEQLRQAGARLEMLPVSRSPDDALAKVRRIGELLDRKAQAEALAQRMSAHYQSLGASVASMKRHPRVVFLMSAGAGSPMAAGRHTAADRVIALTGGTNVAARFEGYKPVSPEAMVALAPDVIMLMRERATDVGGVEGVLKLPGVTQTPAGKAQRILFIDGQALLGFGPRNAAEAVELQQTLAGAAP